MTITLTKEAAKSIERMDSRTKRRIVSAIYNLPSGDVKKLKGYTAGFRLRVGNWRILFTMTADEIIIGDVLPRGDAYK